jgi:hypothetical protein
MKSKKIAFCLFLCGFVARCGESPTVDFGPDADEHGHTAPTSYTREVNAAAAGMLPL